MKTVPIVVLGIFLISSVKASNDRDSGPFLVIGRRGPQKLRNLSYRPEAVYVKLTKKNVYQHEGKPKQLHDVLSAGDKEDILQQYGKHKAHKKQATISHDLGKKNKNSTTSKSVKPPVGRILMQALSYKTVEFVPA